MAEEEKSTVDLETVNLSKSNNTSTLPSNEEIIEEITKGLDSSSLENVTAFDDGDSSQESASQHVPDSGNDIPEDFDKSEEEDVSVKHDDDFIDEDSMKDAELTYSDDDKERLRQEADFLKSKGNDCFKATEFKKSADCYTLALRTCPLMFTTERAVMYSNRAASKMKLDLKKSAIEDCTKAIELNPTYLKAYFRRAQMYEETDKLDEALSDYKKILELDPRHQEANIAVRKLPEQIEIRNEKMKTEMIAKLKDLGNMILRPFGLSTNNFQLNQDPNSGGYSVNFQQNAK